MARRSYVQVKIDGKYKLIPKEDYRPPEQNRSAMIMGDLKPYKSMVTGEMITSRRAHREHLRKHDLVEIGNEKPRFTQRGRTRDDSIKRELYHLWENVSQEGPR